MTVKQYLSQVQVLKRLVRATQDRVDEIETMMQNVRAIRYDKLNVQASAPEDRMSENIIRLEAARDLMIRQAADYYMIYHTIETQISAISNQLYSDILNLRYLQGHSLRQIAEILAYSETYIMNAHGRALAAFGKQFLGL